MRLWTLHPKYVDSQDLLALWWEALLARAVLADKSKGYGNHPQLNRFRDQPDSVAAIATYLQEIHSGGKRRGFRFEDVRRKTEGETKGLEMENRDGDIR